MVKIIDYQKRINQDDLKEFFVLVLQGDLEIIQSKQSGNLYATAKKVSMPTTFNEEGCKAMIGKDIEGKIDKVPCEPYNYTVEETGEIIELDYRYEFIPKGSKSSVVPGEAVNADLETYSENGILEHAD
ncbi:MAG: hypothetical protein RJQ00_07215 [Vicingaceae bacterium]